MAYAISVFFDTATDHAVRALWRAVDEAGISSVLSRGPYNPHLTLAICEHLDIDGLRDDLERFISEPPPIAPIPLRFASVGAFPGNEGVMFLAATPTLNLVTFHAHLHVLINRRGKHFSPYYAPNAWNPHCTLALGLSDAAIAQAVTLCRNLLADTWVGTITHIGIVDTPAEVELCRIPFAAESVR